MGVMNRFCTIFPFWPGRSVPGVPYFIDNRKGELAALIISYTFVTSYSTSKLVTSYNFLTGYKSN